MDSGRINLKKLLVAGVIGVAVGSGIGAIFGLSKNNPFVPEETPSIVSEKYYTLYDGKLGKDEALLLCNEGVPGAVPEYRLRIKTKFMNLIYEDFKMDGALESYIRDFSHGKGLFTRSYMKGTPECNRAEKSYLKYMGKIEKDLWKKGVKMKLFP